MVDSNWLAPPDPTTDPEGFKEYILDAHNKLFGIGNSGGITATDPGDSTATTVSELKDDFNELLTNLRAVGLIE